ncbi:uncharacterized protein YodC (DUF2158 family) [Ochrobactrum sp. RH1CCR137]|nr:MULTISPECIES: DUF2158 domain-containing protein [unclassified Ochrobactrum]MBA8843979.1 uncharacterized protein YodC (DUF2158 family) [Ochrobactrum sp. RH1CCR137]MBA8856483.1 uncharacterized protein YodC (DUF2158 family) [Ochrobactrum sp. RH1CCR134]
MGYKVGDIVQLKSGGPKMTVDHEISSTTVSCSWFAGAKHERANFHVNALHIPSSDEKK